MGIKGFVKILTKLSGHYANHSLKGCEYGDHWKDYCAENVVPPNVADVCGRYASQCCGTCKEYEETGHPGNKHLFALRSPPRSSWFVKICPHR